MSGHWYIDSLDARAGLAFASFRQPDLIEGNAIEDAETTVFVAPPSFEPEIVANRAVAFAAQRGSFQWGLFNAEGEEFPFRTLEGVAEFVRRVYLRSGGGDANPDGGPPAPSPETPGGVPREPTRLELGELGGGANHDIVILLQTCAESFAKRVEKCAPGDEQPFQDWYRPILAGRPAAALTTQGVAEAARAGDRLARSALVLTAEMIRRRPSGQGVDMSADWLLRAFRLAGLIDRLGIWPLMADLLGHTASAKPFATASEHFVSDLPALADAARAMHQELKAPHEWCVVDAARTMLVTGEPPVLDHPLMPWWIVWPWHQLAELADTDAFDDLDRIPVPVTLMPREPANNPSLRTLLLAVAANPATLASKNSYADELRAELVLLAAAYLTRPDVATHYGPWALVRAPVRTQPSPEVIRILALRRVEVAAAWLANNLARRVFADQVEGMIDRAAALEYA